MSLGTTQVCFDPAISAPTAEETITARGKFQWVYYPSDHLFARLFPDRVKEVAAGQDADLRRTPLHLVTGVLASCCARPLVQDPHLLSLAVGGFFLSPETMESNLHTAMQAGSIPIKPYTGAQWRRVCDTFLASKAALLEISAADVLTSEPVTSHSDVATSSAWMYVIRIVSPDTDSPLLHNYGEIVEYLGPHYTAQEKVRKTEPGRASYNCECIWEAVLSAVKELQPRMSSSLDYQGKAFQLALERSRWPEILEPRLSVPPLLSIHDRATLYVNAIKRVPGDDMVELLVTNFQDTLQNPSAGAIHDFFQPALSRHVSTPAACFLELRKLMSVLAATSPSTSPDLESPGKLVQLNTFLHSRRSTWQAESFKTDCKQDFSAVNLVAVMLQRLQSLHSIAQQQHLLQHDTGSPLGTATSTFTLASQVASLTVDALTDILFVRLEDRMWARHLSLPLPHHGDLEREKEDKAFAAISSLPWWYMPIRDITLSGSGLAMKFLLGAVKSLPCKSGLYLSSLRQHWNSFFNLRLVWNETEPLTSEMLTFKPTGTPQPALSFKAGRLAHVDVLKDIVAQERKQVRGTKGVDFNEYNKAQILVCPRKLEKYKTFMDRALSTIGFTSVGRKGSVLDSHGAAIDTLDDFIETGETLPPSRHSQIRAYALKFLNAVELEAEVTFKAFLASEDPTAPLPSSYVSTTSQAYTFITQKTKKIARKLEEQPFTDSDDPMPPRPGRAPKQHKAPREASDPVDSGTESHRELPIVSSLVSS